MTEQSKVRTIYGLLVFVLKLELALGNGRYEALVDKLGILVVGPRSI